MLANDRFMRCAIMSMQAMLVLWPIETVCIVSEQIRITIRGRLLTGADGRGHHFEHRLGEPDRFSGGTFTTRHPAD